MSDHIDAVRRAIEFRRPGHLPMEIVDVPGIYNAYHTLDPERVRLIPGTEDFDALWTNCYSMFHTEVGRTPEGLPIKQDQFGTRLMTPREEQSAYVLLEHPLKGCALKDYRFPDPDDADPHFARLGEVIGRRYPDRFVDGFIDAGIFLTTQFLYGLEEFLLKVADDIEEVTEAYARVADYYLRLAPKYKKAGAHMITVIEDLGGRDGLVISPALWRARFKPILQRFIDGVHDLGLYAGVAIDGSSRDVIEELPGMKIDVFTVFDIKTTGLETIRRALGGRMCVKATVDMQTSLAVGTPQDVAREVEELVRAFHGADGGFIAQVVRWHRPEFPAANVAASVAAFNAWRKG